MPGAVMSGTAARMGCLQHWVRSSSTRIVVSKISRRAMTPTVITKQGLIPIVAHVDRYIGRFRTFGIPKRLAELPVLVQANAEFFLEKPTSSMALRMLKRNEIHLLGSDCHNLDARKPNLRAALDLIERRMGADPLAAIQKFQAYALQNE